MDQPKSTNSFSTILGIAEVVVNAAELSLLLVCSKNYVYDFVLKVQNQNLQNPVKILQHYAKIVFFVQFFLCISGEKLHYTKHAAGKEAFLPP